ncbi:enoyl-CoA hydratase/isomerase [Colletotrichum graminicola]|uniref:Enoyl-CoA hydratase/isomerase n=1 Tax=Colletotrichum graminicola (strain M1.001 / M2 / FGSC 10212) TaxID=645133 RepID=E3Q382_COLGM|nr:enoyl-CoA hydratase/isomerase [Colletotrichum graminicola M1.001]EFQ25061.1 enoyl-CoA hydratase/isomerase [Colletotrichum graminicola M1.001]WDK15343.1 enoyl-CoA hydratase/isomerase [Colletotrichum graminicola]
MASLEDSVISLEYRGRVALLTIDNDRKLNALAQMQYYDLAQKLREIATHDEVFITVLTAKGRYFSAGADVTIARTAPDGPDAHRHWLQSFVAFNLNITQAFYSHPKVLVVGLNGPVVGLSAALVAFADFVYATPATFLLTPFSSIGLVAEGGASRALVQRLGVGKANEALIMSKRITAEELLHVGFVNKVFDTGRGEDARFRELVLREVDERLGDHLIGESLTGIKALIRRPEMDVMDRQNSLEVFAGLERFLKGVPQEEFRKLASGEKRHKL